MRSYSRSHLANSTLASNLSTNFGREDVATAELLADIAEFDARRLYVPAGYESMLDYCVHNHGRSEDATRRRIHAARVARKFPAIFAAVADGRLHMSAVCQLAPHLIPENADELLKAAENKTKSQIDLLIATRFPRTEELPMVSAAPSTPSFSEPNRAAHVEACVPGRTDVRHSVAPLAADRFAIHVSVGARTHDKLAYIQALSGESDLATLLDRSLDARIRELEKRKFAATAKPRRGQPRVTKDPRHIPADVKRAVWERDGGQCTFVSKNGHRCTGKRPEFDHIEPVARGGQATVGNLRLRCRAHNQFEADRTFGTGFMDAKRNQTRRDTPAKTVAPDDLSDDPSKDVMAGLRELGFRQDEARRASEFAARLQSATIEERMRAALQFLGRRFRPQRIAFLADGDTRSSIPQAAASRAS